jgi:gas vesicle protein
MNTTTSTPTVSVLSKKRYYAIYDTIKELFGDSKIDVIMTGIEEIMKFHPQLSFPPEKSKKVQEFVKKRTSELNISVYQYSNGQAYYQKNKEKLNKRRTENARRARSLTTDLKS